MSRNLLVFLLACLPARLGAAYAAYQFPAWLPWMGLLAAIVAINWLFGSFSHTGFFGGKVWWASMRPVHACIYLVFAAMAFAKVPQAYLLLVLDALVGLVAGVVHYQSMHYPTAVAAKAASPFPIQ